MSRKSNSGKSVKERLLNLSRAENYNPFWNGFLRKIKYKGTLDFPSVGKLIRERLSPYWEAMK